MTNQASEVKRNSLNKSDIDVKLDKALGYMTMVWEKSSVFGQPPDYSHVYLTGKQEAKTAIQDLIRTEKLKLLAEVRERVVGEDRLLMTMRPPILKVDPSSGRSDDEIEYLTEMNTRLDNDHAQYNRVYAQSQLQAEQRTELTRLEAGL